MDEKKPMHTIATASSEELLQAQAELWCHAMGYLRSIALYSAVKLGIASAIHRCGGAATLSDLLATIPLHPSKHPYLPRLMTMLAAAGIFTADHGGAPAAEGEAATTAAAACVYYRLTPVSRLLVDDVAGDGRASLSRYVLMAARPFQVMAVMHLPQWLQGEDTAAAAKTPFALGHGEDFYGAHAGDAELNAVFNEGMEADSLFVAELLIRGCGDQVLDGVASLVDVGGGNGTMATAIAEAFPHVKCSVLELPHLVDSIAGAANGVVQFVPGDMMEFIPPADVVLLKFVLHNWSDEDCVVILKRCREAVSLGTTRSGKVVIIDTVLGSPSPRIFEAQAMMDICMMALFASGKERDEQNWQQMFMDAGFSHYKTRPVLGVRSVIEVYP